MIKAWHLLATFISGTLVGAGITYAVVNTKAEKKWSEISQMEIDSVKSRFTVPKVELKKEKEKMPDVAPTSPLKEIVDRAKNKPELSQYAKKIGEYINYSNKSNDDGDAHLELKNNTKPYVISPDEFGEDEEYDQVELTYYSDGVLADEDDTILNIEEVIGRKSIDHIGDYEDDSVHVKNEARKVYYEVLVDERTYEDATGKKKPEVDKDYDLYKSLDKKNPDEDEED